MTYTAYKIIHVTAVLALFLSLGGLIFRAQLNQDEKSLRKLGGLTSALALIIALISGFGIIAKLKLGVPGWVIGKLLIWLSLGGLIGVIRRKPECSRLLWGGVILLGLAAAFLAIAKPF